MYEIVVARFNEDLNWLNGVKQKLTIYNKGKSNLSLDFIPLANIGREATTILYHIITKYKTLNDNIIFLQGNPFEHYKNTKEFLTNLPDSVNSLYKFSNGCYAIADRLLTETQASICANHVYPEDFHNKFFKKPKKTFVYASGAQYLVSRKNIHSKPITFYKSILEAFAWKGHEPWSIERIWPTIFQSENKYKFKTNPIFM